jgi:hypothetical protein
MFHQRKDLSWMVIGGAALLGLFFVGVPFLLGSVKGSLLISERATPGGGEAASADVVTDTLQGKKEGLPLFLELRVEKPKVKGIHITSWVAGSRDLFSNLIDLIDHTELNTAVIDLKEADGRIAYDADIPLAREIGSVERRIRDLDQLVRTLKDHHIYKIARIVVFKDTYLAEHRPDIALQSRSTGRIWRDFKGEAFGSPFSKEVQEYNLQLAEDAARRGFDEIQLDYIRFPSDGIMSDIRYPPSHNEEEAINTILDFVRQVRGRLAPYQVALSVDVFGLTTLRDDVGIGQNFKELSQEVDFISPMVYPSHYRKGSYGFQSPNAFPYEIITHALKDAVRKATDESHPEVLTRSKIRPWLQDFTLGSPHYGPREVRTQIQAAYDIGIEEWLLWNPQVRYSRTALLPSDSQVAERSSD